MRGRREEAAVPHSCPAGHGEQARDFIAYPGIPECRALLDTPSIADDAQDMF